MTKYRIRYLPKYGTYEVQEKSLGFGFWKTLGKDNGFFSEAFRFGTQQDALDYISTASKVSRSTKPVVVWEGER